MSAFGGEKPPASKEANNSKDDKSGSGEDDELESHTYEDDHPYRKLLEEAQAASLGDIERTNCVVRGQSDDGTPVLAFIPRLGFDKLNCTTEADRDKILRRMLLRFIKVADEVVSKNYILVYAHTALSILSQQPIIYKYYKMLPRSYKKNVQKLIVLHPTFLIRSFFEVGVRWFVKEKFYRKLNFLGSIIEAQGVIGATGTTLPPALIKYEMEDNGKKSGGDSGGSDEDSVFGTVPLEKMYVASLGTTDFIFRCCRYLESNQALTTEGLFRISGDNDAVDVVKSRIVSSIQPQAMDTILFKGEEGPEEIDQDDFPYLLISDIHSAASALKVSLRRLPQPLITMEAYQPLLDATKKHAGGDVDAWDRAVDLVLVSMPASHFNTLQYLLLILAKVALNIADTRMDAGNLGKVLAPTVFRSPRAGSDDSDPAQLFGEITLAGKVLTRLISRKLELEAASLGGNGTDDTSNLNAEEEIESRLSNRVKSMAFKRGGR